MAIRISWREHVSKDGKTTRYARYRSPERQADGSIKNRPVERSVGSLTRREGARQVEQWFKEALAAAETEPQTVPTFAEIAVSYQLTQGGSPYFKPILLEIGLRNITDIDQALIMSVAAAIYPKHTAATINRQLFTPVIAALRMQGDLGKTIAAKLTRPKGHDSLPDLDVPDPQWYRAVLPVANPWLRAFLLVGRLHGRRPGELLNRTREHFDAEARTLTVYDTKGRQTIVLNLAEPAWASIMAIPNLIDANGIEAPEDGGRAYRLTHAKQIYLFGTNQKTTMRKWLLAACAAAGVRYHMPKEAGRHAFATGAIKDGKSTAWLTKAGHWKSPKVPLAKYVHLEAHNVAAEARADGESWFSKSVGKMPRAVRIGVKTGDGAEANPAGTVGTAMGIAKVKRPSKRPKL